MENKKQFTQVRVEHKTLFTTVSNTFIRDKRLSLKAKGLLLTLLSLNDKEWDFSIAGLCNICKESKTAIYNAIDELIKYSYCIRKQDRNEKGLMMQMSYTFYEEPLSENQDADNWDSDKHPQRNTNIKKKQKEEKTNFSFFSEKNNKRENADAFSFSFSSSVAADVSEDYGLCGRDIVDYWNNALSNLSDNKKQKTARYTSNIRKALAQCLQDYSETEIKNAISNYCSDTENDNANDLAYFLTSKYGVEKYFDFLPKSGKQKDKWE